MQKGTAHYVLNHNFTFNDGGTCAYIAFLHQMYCHPSLTEPILLVPNDSFWLLILPSKNFCCFPVLVSHDINLPWCHSFYFASLNSVNSFCTIWRYKYSFYTCALIHLGGRYTSRCFIAEPNHISLDIYLHLNWPRISQPTVVDCVSIPLEERKPNVKPPNHSVPFLSRTRDWIAG